MPTSASGTATVRPLWTWIAGALVALAAAGSPARAGEAHYLLVFGSQCVPNNPNYAHSFATFVRATWPGDPCKDLSLEAHTISWLPVNLAVRTGALCPEPGHNFTLEETLKQVLMDGERVSLWGPYPIQPELYQRALRRIAKLESGEIRYKANDAGYNSARVSNCIHAVTTIFDGPRTRVLSPGWGEVASYAITLRARPWFLEDTHQDWVAVGLGLSAYPIIYRELRPPLSGTYLGAVRRLLGHERDLRPTFGPPAVREF